MESTAVPLCQHCRGARATVRCAERVYCSRRCAEHSWLGLGAPRIGFILRLTKGTGVGAGSVRPYDIDYLLPTQYIDAQVDLLLRGEIQFTIGATPINIDDKKKIALSWSKQEAEGLKKNRFNMLAAQQAMRGGAPMPKQLVLFTEKLRASTVVDPDLFELFEAHFEGAKTLDAFNDKVNSMPPNVRKLVESDAFKLREVSQLIARGSQRIGSIVAAEQEKTPLQRFAEFLVETETEARRALEAKLKTEALVKKLPPVVTTRKPFGSLTSLYLITMMNEGRAPTMPDAPAGTVVFDQFAFAHPRSTLKPTTIDNAKIDVATFTKLEALAK